MKNVIYTGAFRFPEGDAGAIRVLNIAKIFRALGYNVIFISWGGESRLVDKSEGGQYYYQKFEYINSGDIDRKNNNILKRVINHFFDGKNAYSYILDYDDSVDMIIGYNMSMYSSIKMKRLCKKKNTLLISDLTEWYGSKELPGGKFSPVSWVNEINMRLVQKYIKHKIVISSFLDNYYNETKNIILPPLVDGDEERWKKFKPVLEPFDGVRLIYAGTPSTKDLLEVMIDAVVSSVKMGCKIQFIILGVIKDEIKKYNKYKEMLSLSRNIVFIGKIPQNEVPLYYDASDFSIIIRKPTRKNMAGFPTKLTEAMRSGCPVILNYTSDISKYVYDGYNGFVMSGWSSVELQKILFKIITLSRSEIETMKLNALKCAIEKFDYVNYIDKVAGFLK